MFTTINKTFDFGNNKGIEWEAKKITKSQLKGILDHLQLNSQLELKMPSTMTYY